MSDPSRLCWLFDWTQIWYPGRFVVCLLNNSISQISIVSGFGNIVLRGVYLIFSILGGAFIRGGFQKKGEFIRLFESNVEYSRANLLCFSSISGFQCKFLWLQIPLGANSFGCKFLWLQWLKFHRSWSSYNKWLKSSLDPNQYLY